MWGYTSQCLSVPDFWLTRWTTEELRRPGLAWPAPLFIQTPTRPIPGEVLVLLVAHLFLLSVNVPWLLPMCPALELGCLLPETCWPFEGYSGRSNLALPVLIMRITWECLGQVLSSPYAGDASCSWWYCSVVLQLSCQYAHWSCLVCWAPGFPQYCVLLGLWLLNQHIVVEQQTLPSPRSSDRAQSGANNEPSQTLLRAFNSIVLFDNIPPLFSPCGGGRKKGNLWVRCCSS